MLLAFSVLSSLIVFSGPVAGHGADTARNLPPGVTQARLRAVPEIPALNAMLLEGIRQGVMVSWHGPGPLLVLGEYGEPMLKFSEYGVAANSGSATWQRLQGLSPADGGEKHWQPVSRSSSYGWMDPRLTLKSGPRPSGKDPLGQWRIPLQTGNQDFDLKGEFYWRPLPPAAARVHDRR